MGAKIPLEFRKFKASRPLLSRCLSFLSRSSNRSENKFQNICLKPSNVLLLNNVLILKQMKNKDY